MKLRARLLCMKGKENEKGTYILLINSHVLMIV